VIPEESARLASIKTRLACRSAILNGIRAFFYRQNFIEIDTPIRVPAVAPEQYISPFTSEGWFLSTSPELQMKRLLSAGYEKIFQICHCFRRDERGRHHNPEFTMLEWYRAGADYHQIIRDTEELVVDLASRTGSGNSLVYQGQRIDLTIPWPRITVREAYLKWAGWNPLTEFDGQRFDDDMVDKIIPNFPSGQPTVILDYPVECASLARLKAGSGEAPAAERAEVFIGGLEIANAYSELNDAAEQEKRFKLEMEQIQREGKPVSWPQKFLDSVKNLPECGGIAVGVDRLVMLLCDASSIDEVIAFPSDLL
jgi:lysyl-tRNA synthetase class 2